MYGTLKVFFSRGKVCTIYLKRCRKTPRWNLYVSGEDLRHLYLATRNGISSKFLYLKGKKVPSHILYKCIMYVTYLLTVLPVMYTNYYV